MQPRNSARRVSSMRLPPVAGALAGVSDMWISLPLPGPKPRMALSAIILLPPSETGYLCAMPELPEVETVRRGLEPVLTGARLIRVRQNRPDLRFPFPDRFAERLEGAAVERLDRRAKYLLMPLSRGDTWITHLGMTGRFTLD